MAYKNYEDQKACWRKHYADNKEKYIERNKQRKIVARKFLKEYKESRPCIDCCNYYPHYVMDFDHLDKKTKYKNISQMTSHTIKSIQKEINKCELVCANCHRIRTYSGMV